jgi:hypothetical protein
MVNISLLCALDYQLNEAIDLVYKSHNDRVVLRSKWKVKKSPINYGQFSFLTKIHKNIYVDSTRYYNWLLIPIPEHLSSTTENLYEYFNLKITENKDLYLRFQLTYLRKFMYNDPQYNKIYSSLNNLRKKILIEDK